MNGEENSVPDREQEQVEELPSRRRMVSTVLKGLAGAAVAVTVASLAAPSEALACRCGERCCSGSPVVQ